MNPFRGNQIHKFGYYARLFLVWGGDALVHLSCLF